MVFITPQIGEINPIDFYNQYKFKESEDLILKKATIEKTGIGEYSEILNKSDRIDKHIEYNGNYYKVLKPNSVLDIKIEIYSPFMVMQKLKFNGDFYIALNYVKTEFFKLGGTYIRVGTDYFKEIVSPDRYGINRKELIGWKRQTITDDLGSSAIKHIRKFDSFTIEPNNLSYKSVVNNKYNLFSQPTFKQIDIDYTKKELEEKCKWSLFLVEHVFKEQFDYGKQYLKIFWEQPKQILPILALVSQKRHTAKSTFITWLGMLFGENSTILNPQDISSQFNGGYANKTLIMIEESHFEKKQDKEKIKNLSTQKMITVNTKFIRHHTIPFYAKIIITSNDADKFISIDDDEIRYWVRELGTIPKESYNSNLDNDLVQEIPYFLKYLKEYVVLDNDLGGTRMMFQAKDITTKALEKVKKESRSGLHKEIEYNFNDHCANNPQVEFIRFIASDIKKKWFKNERFSNHYINSVLKDEMKFEKPNGKSIQRYVPLESQGINNNTKTGAYYEFKNEYFDESLTVPY